MKIYKLLMACAIACLPLTACGKVNKPSKECQEASSLKKANSKLKKQIRQQKHSNKDTSSNKDNSQPKSANGQTQPSSNQQSPKKQGVSNADDAVAAARAKYGDMGGYIHCTYMVDGRTGQPIRNADGSYFVKGTANDGTMTGTKYSLDVYPDGTVRNK